MATTSNEGYFKAVCKVLHMYMEESAPVQSHHVRNCFTVKDTNYYTLLYRVLLKLPHKQPNRKVLAVSTALPRMELTGKEDSLQ